jgi:hypothetical protein
MTTLNSGVESTQDSASATTRIFHVLLNLCQEFIKAPLIKTSDEDGDPFWTLDSPISLLFANDLGAYLKTELESGGFALVDNDYSFSIGFVSTEGLDGGWPLDIAFGSGFIMNPALPV